MDLTELPELLPGDLFATRNADPRDNSSPGHWNHLAIFVGGDQVVESQAWRGTILTALAEFVGRYPEILVLRFREGDGAKMAEVARSQVGTPYWRLASVPLVLRPAARGDNCVSAVRRARAGVGWRDPRWRKPDDAVEDRLIKQVQWSTGRRK